MALVLVAVLVVLPVLYVLSIGPMARLDHLDFDRRPANVTQAIGPNTIDYGEWLDAHGFCAEAKALIEGP